VTGEETYLQVDSLVIELEDGVAPNAKQLAREQAAAHLSTLQGNSPWGHRCFDLAVRVNSLSSGEMEHDLKVGISTSNTYLKATTTPGLVTITLHA